MSTLAMGYYPINASTQQTSSSTSVVSSVEANKIYKKLTEILTEIKSFDQKWVFNELEDLRMTATYKNWDNLGSSPLDEDTYQISKRFITALPSSLPAPELTVDCDGEMHFDWYGSSGQTFTASLRKDGRIAFAGRFSARNRLSGVEEFNDTVPKKLVESINIISAR